MLQEDKTTPNTIPDPHGQQGRVSVCAGCVVVVVGVIVVAGVVIAAAECLFMCRLRWSEREKALSHSLHWKGLSPVCLR